MMRVERQSAGRASKMWTVAAVVVTAAAVVACGAEGPSSNGSVSGPSSETSVERTTSSLPGGYPHGAAGSREVGIVLEDVVGSASIVVGLHPLDSPLRFSVSGGAQLEVCPSDYLGNTDPSASSWNPDIGFVACLSSSDGSSVEVPGQGRAAHRWVAMTVTPVVRGETTVRLAYTTADSFFQISSINADTAVNITFTPESSTIGVLRTDVNGGPSLGADGLVISPAGLSDAECDFPSEVSCVGPATPEKTASVTFVPRSQGDGVYLAWSSAPA